jgi:hypothetical protein
VQTIAATTTRTGLAVRAQLDTGTYPTGTATSKEEVAALALTPHHWHSEWNYTLHPRLPESAPARDTPPTGRFAPAERAPAWLYHPTLTGHNPHEWNVLLAEFEQQLHDRPTVTLPGGHHHAAHTGLRALSPSDRLLATVVNLRWSTHRSALAHLFGVSVNTISGAIRETKYDLQQIGRTIQPAPIKATTSGALTALLTHEDANPTKDQER